MKRQLPMLLCAFVGFLLIASAFIPPLERLSTYATNSFSILAAIAFILGAGNFLRSHSEKVRRQQSGWAYSLIAIVAFSTMLISGLFKVNVQPQPGFYAYLQGQGATVALAEVAVTDTDARVMNLSVRKAPPDSEHVVTLAGAELGKLKTDDKGRGDLALQAEAAPAEAAGAPPEAASAALRALKPGDELRIGSLMNGTFAAYGRLTGAIEEPHALYGYLYLYAFVPLQQTTFALLAFYVASAAFRAFRARNVESVLLLGTAFIILLGRTPAGHAMTAWLPREGFGSFFYIPNLSNWIMAYPFTAGGRAIMIGIALGVISTSLRVLLGIDRSYLGSDRGGG